MKLSFLDESSTKNIPFAKVELKNLLLKVYSNLKSVAKKYDIEFKFELEEAYIHGSKELFSIYAITLLNTITQADMSKSR